MTTKIHNINVIISPSGQVISVAPGQHRQEIANRTGYQAYRRAWFASIPKEPGRCTNEDGERCQSASDYGEQQKGWAMVHQWPGGKAQIVRQHATEAANEALRKYVEDLLDTSEWQTARKLLDEYF